MKETLGTPQFSRWRARTSFLVQLNRLQAVTLFSVTRHLAVPPKNEDYFHTPQNSATTWFSRNAFFPLETILLTLTSAQEKLFLSSYIYVTWPMCSDTFMCIFFPLSPIELNISLTWFNTFIGWWHGDFWKVSWRMCKLWCLAIQGFDCGHPGMTTFLPFPHPLCQQE